MGDAFLAQAGRGRARRWHYAVGLVLILAAWFALSFALFVGLAWGGDVLDRAAAALGPWARGYLELNIPFVPLIPAIALVVLLWHRRPPASLVAGAPRVAWGRIALGFAATAVLFGLLAWLGDDGRHPGSRAALLAALPLILVLTPLQAAGEELLFRGYVLQATAAFTASRPAIIAINGALFAALHGANPAVLANPLALGGYFLSGAGLALVALRDDGLELPIGGHIANNLVSFMALAWTGQSIDSEAEDYAPLMHYLTSLAPIAVLLIVLRLRPRRAAAGPRAADPAQR